MFEAEAGAPLEIELLIAPDATLMLVAAVMEPLRAANRTLGRSAYRLRVTTFDGGPARTASGVEIPCEGRFDPAASQAPLFVAASYEERTHVGRAELARLAAASRRRIAIAGLEAGAWSLARAGLLRGRRATTHWEDLEAFAEAHPDVDVVADRWVADGARITSGGSAPTLDLMLAIIRARQGAAVAGEASRLFLYVGGAADTPQLRRSSGSSGDAPIDPRVDAAIAVMEANISSPIALERIAAAVGVGGRRLRELFADELGETPQQRYLGVRLSSARRRLAETRLTIAEIALQSGFASAAAFSRAHRARFGQSPRAARDALRAARAAAHSAASARRTAGR